MLPGMGSNVFGWSAAFAVAMLLAACGSESARDGESASMRAIAGRVPADTVVYARIASLDALVASAGTAVKAFGGDAGTVGRERLLALLGPMAGDTTQIDGSRAIGVALVAAKATRPAPVLFVPVQDGEKYAASLRASGLEPVVDGDYVVVSLGGKYTKPATPSPIATALPPGLLAARIDVALAAANLGVMIQSGLDVAKRELGRQTSQRAGEQGLDGEVLAELYVNFAKSLLTNGTTLDLVVDDAGGVASLVATYTAKAGSELDGWSSPPVDVSSFAGKLTGSAAIDVVAVADWTKLWPRVESIANALFDAYPPAMRRSFQDIMKSYPQLYASIGPVLVGQLDVAETVRVDLHMAPPDAKAMLAEFDAFAKRPELANLGVMLREAAPADGGAIATRAWTVKLDPDRLAGGAMGDAGSQAMAQQMSEVVRSLFGDEGLPAQLAATDGRGVFQVGKPTVDTTRALAPASGAWPAAIRPALRVVEGCNPLFVERIDYAAMMRGFLAAMPSVAASGMPKPPADARADVTVGIGVRGAEWRAVLGVDLAGFGAMVRQMMPK
jgi:hypothetical protein